MQACVSAFPWISQHIVFEKSCSNILLSIIGKKAYVIEKKVWYEKRDYSSIGTPNEQSDCSDARCHGHSSSYLTNRPWVLAARTASIRFDCLAFAPSCHMASDVYWICNCLLVLQSCCSLDRRYRTRS